MPQQRTSTKGRTIQTLLGLLVSVVCIWWVLDSVQKDQVFAHIRNVSIAPLLLAALATCVSYLLRSYRWIFFFDTSKPTFGDSFRCLIIGFFMNNVLPARMGELVRAHLGGRATNQSRSSVLATVAGERLADGLMISLLFALFFHPGEQVGARASELYLVSYLFLAATIMTFGVLLMRKKIFVLLSRLERIMPGNLSRYTLIRLQRFIKGLEPLLHPARLLLLGALSLLVWLVELYVYNQVAIAFGQELHFGGLVLFLAAVNFSSLIPAAPGGIGVIEAFASLALTRIGLDHERALAMVATQHLIQYTVVGLPGLYFFITRLGGRIPEEEMDEAFETEEDRALCISRFADVSEPRPDPVSEEFSTLLENEAEPKLELSIVIPAYNEEQRLPKTLLEIIEYFSKHPTSCEVLVVDDGSTDGTSEVVRKFETLSPIVRLLCYPGNRGKGYAVRFGMLNARGNRLLFADADGATPIEELSRLQEALNSGADLAIGSRALLSMETSVETVWYRRFLGRVFNGIVNMVLLPGIADTQCGFKLFSRRAARTLFSKQRAERFSFDVEVLFLARKFGYRIAEVPVNWTNVPGSKVNLAKDSLAMFFDLLRFRARDALGGYGAVPVETP